MVAAARAATAPSPMPGCHPSFPGTAHAAAMSPEQVLQIQAGCQTLSSWGTAGLDTLP